MPTPRSRRCVNCGQKPIVINGNYCYCGKAKATKKEKREYVVASIVVGCVLPPQHAKPVEVTERSSVTK